MSRTVRDPAAAADPREPADPSDLAGRGPDRLRSLPVTVGGLVIAGVIAVVAVLGGLLLTGAATPSLLFDPGPVVRWGLPLATLVSHLATALTIGVLVLAAVALPVQAPPPGTGHTVRTRAFAPAVRLAAIGAGVWTAATVVQTVLTFSQTSGTLLTDPTFGRQLLSYVQDTEPGRGLVITALVAAVVTVVASGATTIGTVGGLLLLCVVGLVPPALAGHAAGTADHETAVTSLGFHLLGTSVWVGGLAGIVLLRHRLEGRLPGVVRVYSALAFWAFLLVGFSGVVNAWIRLPALADLGSDYGLLVVGKVVALGVLGTAGALHRRRAYPDLLAGVPGTFARLAAVELVVMGAALGLAGALAASAPPTTGRSTSPTLAESLTGYPMPPPLTPTRWLTEWQPDLLWLTVAVLGATLYLAAARRLWSRGDRWSALSTISWVLGLVFLVYVTSGPPMVYGRVLFSAHMTGHMALSMLVPIFLVLGAPVTLALRALAPRRDGSRGPREWLLAVVESRYARLLSFPPVAAFLFAGSLVFFYFSPLFELALRTHVGHELMHVHFLFAGYLFAWVLIGLDPGPRRVGYPLRLITLFAAMAFHAFFGVTLLSGGTVLAPEYFSALGRAWGSDLLADQRFGGGIAWGIGDIPAIVMAVIIAVQWARTDDREARRLDRAADRDGDAELKAYNAMLSRVADEDDRRRDRA